MSSSELEKNPSPTHGATGWLIAGLAILGMVINVLLASQSLTGDAIAGCEGGSSCDDVLNSRWSVLCGIPVAIFGILLYIALLIALYRKNSWVSSVCLGLMLGAVAWFVLVQAVIIGRFCPWCMASHSVAVMIVCLGLWRDKIQGKGVSSVRIVAIHALMASVGIAAIQYLGPLPDTHRIENVGEDGKSNMIRIHARGEGRKVAFDHGRIVYNVETLPHMGSSDAKHVVVEYFDYQCASCRIMRRYLTGLVESRPDEICVILLPVPLDRGCNPKLPSGHEGYVGSCEKSRIALALWRVSPDLFQDFHQKLMDESSITVSGAMEVAGELISLSRLEEAMRDPWIDELLVSNIADWDTFSSQNRHLPKLLIKDRRILHGLPPTEAEFIRVMEQELGMPSS